MQMWHSKAINNNNIWFIMFQNWIWKQKTTNDDLIPVFRLKIPSTCLHKYGLTDRTLILYPHGIKAYLKLFQILPAAHAN